MKEDGAPTIPSRWLQRLAQLSRGLKLQDAVAAGQAYAEFAARLMDVPQGPRLPRPKPMPPVETRPRRLSVTEIETWLRDPYAIYARHVLRLRPLDALDEAIGPLERGTALHKALEIFIAKFRDGLPEDAVGRLLAIADQVFAQAGVPKAALALWRPRFEGAACGFVDWEKSRRDSIAASHLEIKGSLKLGDFELTGVADRIDILKDGGAAILDYKTGKPPTNAQVKQLLTPQLPLEGAILAEGGFAGIGKQDADELLYLQLSGARAREQSIPDVPALIAKAVEQLLARIAWFDEAETPYRSRVRPYSADADGDYDHLARVREWSPSGWSEEP
jgi:ATP-dependent helicase/nuclease subunit B